MTIYVIVTVFQGVADSVECFLNESEALAEYAKKQEEFKDDLDTDVSLHTCL